MTKDNDRFLADCVLIESYTEIAMDKLDDKLSILLDEQAAPPADDALRGAIDAVGGDVNLQYRLRRYRLIGESLRNELPAAIDPGFHAAVMARIDAEDASGSARSTPAAAAASPLLPPWLTRLAGARPVAGLAVAAAVAVVTVALWQPGQRDGGELEVATLPENQGVVIVDPPLAPVAAQYAAGGTRWKVDNPALQQKLNAYLVNHTEYASSVQGIIPQARVAGFDAGR